MKYEGIAPITRGDALRAAIEGDEKALVRAMLAVALYDPDQRFAEGYVGRNLDGSRRTVAWGAVIATGHLGRRFKALDPAMIARVAAMKDLPGFSGIVASALEDIRGPAA